MSVAVPFSEPGSQGSFTNNFSPARSNALAQEDLEERGQVTTLGDPGSDGSTPPGSKGSADPTGAPGDSS